ncbi:MAG: cytochrome c oxidase subunit 3 [Deltaproteobacteria bacterium]|nr:cytochrome c oxidase subunit 3 [Deltaproteobacteria bacterium]MBW2444442.1 cytochrome c oxidase subunit 3 [Deltaproteobacteria bacterium]
MSAPITNPELELVDEAPGRPVVESAVLGTVLFCVVEAMLFAGLVSAHTIVRSNAVEWPPPGQPRLPIESTLLNTAALLLSAPVLFYAGRVFRRNRRDALRPLALAIGLGAFFVAFQGYEWLGLLREGLTLTSSQHGSFFYLMIGMHAAHAVAALVALVWAWQRLFDLRLTPGAFGGAAVFWYFVVAVWPVLYWRVYL